MMIAGPERTAISIRILARPRPRRRAAARGEAGDADSAAPPTRDVPCDWRPLLTVSVPRVSLIATYSALRGSGVGGRDDAGGVALVGHQVHDRGVHGVT